MDTLTLKMKKMKVDIKWIDFEGLILELRHFQNLSIKGYDYDDEWSRFVIRWNNFLDINPDLVGLPRMDENDLTTTSLWEIWYNYEDR